MKGILGVSEKDNTISMMRIIGICLVVLGHAITDSIKSISPELKLLSDFIYSFHMFLFFYLSGLLYERGIRKYLKNKVKFITDKAVLLMVPYITLSAIGYTLAFVARRFGINLLAPNELEIGSILKAFLLNVNHFDTHIWYIYFLFFIFLINIFAPQFVMKKGILLILIIASGWYGVLSLTGVRINTLIYYLVPFILGRWAYRNNTIEQIKSFNGFKVLVCGIVFIAVNVIMIYVNSINAMNPVLGQIKVGFYYEIKILAGLMGTYLVIYIAYKLSKNDKAAKLGVIDNYSYAIYLLHQPYITTACVSIIGKFIGLNAITVVITFFACMTIPIMITKYILRKNRILNVLIVGNR